MESQPQNPEFKDNPENFHPYKENISRFSRMRFKNSTISETFNKYCDQHVQTLINLNTMDLPAYLCPSPYSHNVTVHLR